MQKSLFIFASALMVSIPVFSQTYKNRTFSEAIEDNSMFIEEAYNQENRVVQHISNLVFVPNLTDHISYAFTQEWPAFGLKHQLSYTLQVSSLNRGAGIGFGDIMINYRYQLTYKESFAAFSPRLSVIIPTGNAAKGFGSGSWGLQMNLPVSKRWTNQFINHFNIGTTYLFKVRDEELNFDSSLTSYFAGISSIWLVSEKFNLMLECLGNLNAIPGLNNQVTYAGQAIIAPAFRFAIDIKGLQIVPGVSVPVSVERNSKPMVGGFLYLSFEHGY